MTPESDKWLRDRWFEIANRPANAKNPEVSYGEFVEFYGTLSAADKLRANLVLAEWIDSGDHDLSVAAMMVARKYLVVSLLPPTRSRLAFLDAQLESAKLTTSRELAAIIESFRGLPALVVEELENPEIGLERQRLGDAFRAYWTAPKVPDSIRHTDLDDAYDRLDYFHRLISQASCLLSGQEFDRSKLESDTQLRESLVRMTSDDDDEIRQVAEKYLERLDLIDELLEAARVLRHP